MELFGIEAVSSLALIIEKSEFLQKRHVIVSESKELEKLKSFLFFKKPPIPWYDLPAFSQLKSPLNKRVQLKRRMWQSWAHFNGDSPGIFLATPQALLKRTNISSGFSVIKKGEGFSFSLLSGYIEKAFVEQKGEFSSRSFLIDIFSPAYDRPFRIQLLGDKVQSIHLLDSNFKKREEEIQQALIPSIYEWSWSGESRKKLCDCLRQKEKLLKCFLPPDLFKKISRGESCFGFENLFNCLDDFCSLDHFSQDPQIWIFEPEKTKDHFLLEQSQLQKEHPLFTSENLFVEWERLYKRTVENQEYSKGLKNLKAKSGNQKEKIENQEQCKRLKVSKLKSLNQNSKTQKIKEVDFSFSSNKKLSADKTSGFKTHSDGNLINVRGSFLESFSLHKSKPASMPGLKNFSSSLFRKSKNLKEDLKKTPVQNIIFIGNQLAELKKTLFQEEILQAENEELFCGKNLIFLEGRIKESFFCKGETAYLNAESFYTKKKSGFSSFDFFRQRAKALEFSKLEIGDLLVHRQHGVGEFVGLQSLKLHGKREDFIVLNYREGDKLFVPAYKVSQVKKYSRKREGTALKSLLDRLGNPSFWERKKSQAKKHIQSLAIDLIELYRVRKQKKRKAFAPVKSALDCFVQDFPWTETSDQKKAVQEIMGDMDRDYPMDRLLTADTGFGKTEVALRAVFRALENGFQVCFLAPTTVLALQHFRNFKTRFKNTGFELAILNRFVSGNQRKDTFKKVKEGKIDFLIATHSVFSSLLSFKNLGLLVLDEEHRFGVRQKERLFRFKKNLDVLSLSATPIPRTLNMALTGIKDVSLIRQPPKERRSVHIFLKSWSEGIDKDIVQACQDEKARGGQILFVHNRVKSLYQRAEQIQKLLPDFKIAVAQGQIKNLEKIMLDFFEKKYDLLLSTNIIESGMDIPQANTLFIDRAHEMGLSQIYQLKGRVGRGAHQAVCYLLFPETSRLSVLAKERLKLLEKYAGLGSAFQLALHDLENRGAGSLFGSEQSGHLQNLGEELYFEILNEQLKDQESVFIEPEIQLPFATGIPESYIPDPRLRLVYYKSLSSALDEEAYTAVQYELLEEFGPFPEELNSLFFLLKIRNFCKKLLIRDFKSKLNFISLAFHEKTPISPQNILKMLEKRKGQMISNQSFKFFLKPDCFMEETKQILEELSSFLKKAS